MNEQKNVNTTASAGAGKQDSGRESQPDYALAPDVDIYEDEKGIYLVADMPGVSRERLDIQVNRDALTIEGDARIDLPENLEATYADVRTTRYHRSFTLSAELDSEGIDARLRDGVLRVHIPKRAEAMPRKVEVTHG